MKELNQRRMPVPISQEFSDQMARYPRINTSPEVRLRSALHALGLRFRLQRKVPGRTRRTIDIALPGPRVAVFVDGCFWHGCPAHGVMPKNNREWWHEKLAKNEQRDRDTNSVLVEAGWSVVRVWEHTEAEEAAEQIARLIREDPEPCAIQL